MKMRRTIVISTSDDISSLFLAFAILSFTAGTASAQNADKSGPSKLTFNPPVITYECHWRQSDDAKAQSETVKVFLDDAKRLLSFEFKNAPRIEGDLGSAVSPISATVDSAVAPYTETVTNMYAKTRTHYTVNLYEHGIYTLSVFTDGKNSTTFGLIHYPPFVGPAQMKRIFNCSLN